MDTDLLRERHLRALRGRLEELMRARVRTLSESGDSLTEVSTRLSVLRSELLEGLPRGERITELVSEVRLLLMLDEIQLAPLTASCAALEAEIDLVDEPLFAVWHDLRESSDPARLSVEAALTDFCSQSSMHPLVIRLLAARAELSA